MLRFLVLCCTLLCCFVLCCLILCHAALCCVMLCSVVECCAMLCNFALCCGKLTRTQSIAQTAVNSTFYARLSEQNCLYPASFQNRPSQESDIKRQSIALKEFITEEGSDSQRIPHIHVFNRVDTRQKLVKKCQFLFHLDK